MRSESTKNVSRGFALTEQELRRIVDLLEEQMKKSCNGTNFQTAYELKFRNGVISEPNSIEEILDLENSGSGRVHRFKITLSCGAGADISLQFTDIDAEGDSSTSSIRYSVKGQDRDWVFVTSSLIDERINKVGSPVISRLVGTSTARVLHSISASLAILFLMVFLFFIMQHEANVRINATREMIDGFQSQIANGQPPDVLDVILNFERLRATSDFSSITLVLRIPFLVLFFLLLFLTEFLQLGAMLLRYLMPPYNFLWGDYVAAYEQRRNIRNIVLITVAIGGIVSIIASLIANALSINLFGQNG